LGFADLHQPEDAGAGEGSAARDAAADVTEFDDGGTTVRDADAAFDGDAPDAVPCNLANSGSCRNKCPTNQCGC
jgi:hypothetical protein